MSEAAAAGGGADGPPIRVLAEGLGFPEGPVALPDGSVLVVEIAAGRLTRVDADGTVEPVATLGGGPNGAAIGPDGAVYVCNNGGLAFRHDGGVLVSAGQPDDYSGGRIERVDLESGAVDVLYRECGGFGLRGPNDLVFDASGGFWFTDHPKKRARDRDWGGLYYALPDGSSIEEVIHPLEDPNGVGLSPAGDWLYVADTRPGRVWAWPVEGPGRLGRAPDGVGAHGGRCLVGLPGYQLLDSLAVEENGNVVVATIGNPGLTVVTPEGATEHVPLPDPIPTNVCFGGPGRRTAYVTLSGSGRLAALDWPRPGLALAFPTAPGPQAPHRPAPAG